MVQLPSMSRRWHGPFPTPPQRLLLAACLDADLGRSAANWSAWCDQCDYEREDGASHELASLVVAKIGLEAAGERIAIRSLGWYRRAWFLSELAADAAYQLGRACRERGHACIAIGDLACWLSDVTFAGRRLPIRTVELFVPSLDRGLFDDLRALALRGSAGKAIQNRQIGVRLISGIGDRLVAAAASAALSHGDLACPSAGANIARLAAGNWCWNPPQKLRWMVEVVSLIQSTSERHDLAAQMAPVLARADVGWSAARALRACRAVIPDGDVAGRLDLLIAAAAAVRGGAGAWARGRLRLSPLGPSLSRCQRGMAVFGARA